MHTPATMEAILRLLSCAIGELCPECGATDIEDNGHSGRWLEYRCAHCDHRFGPGTDI